MDIYLADTDPLKDQDRFERLLLQMPENRKKKILRMADPANRRLSLGAGILLSKVLSTFLITKLLTKMVKTLMLL